MKITFVVPAMPYKRPGERPWKTWRYEPLTFAVLKALTPKEVETELFDDRIESISYETDSDLICITVETFTACRAYEIAKKFKEKGKTIVMGGYHTTLVPDEAAKYADCVVVGNGESVWQSLLNDFMEGELKKRYTGSTAFADVLPDRSIYQGKKYMPMALVETGRGCVFRCRFCSVTSYYNGNYSPRPLNSILKEIEQDKNKYMFLLDDNLVANHNFASQLFKEIAPFKKVWTSQGALTIAKNPTLLKQMKKSGCDSILIGFESLNEDNLKQMGKDWNYKLGEQKEHIKRIHDEGIGIYASFVFGYDQDTPDTIDRTLEFALEQGFYFAAFNRLVPFPGTRCYEEFKQAGRLIRDQWWLDPNYKYTDVTFRPNHMGPEELSDKCEQASKEFFKFSSVAKRCVKHFIRNPNPSTLFPFWGQNLKYIES